MSTPQLVKTGFPLTAGSRWAQQLRLAVACHDRTALTLARQLLDDDASAHGARGGLFEILRGALQRRAFARTADVMRAVEDEDLVGARTCGKQAARLWRMLDRTHDAATLRLVSLDSVVRIGQSFQMGPSGGQRLLLGEGLSSCRQCASIAATLEDPICEAEYRSRLGNGLYSSRDFPSAQVEFTRALALWRVLDEQTPGVFRIRLIRCIRQLADSYKQALNDARAMELYDEALSMLATQDQDGRELAAVLHNLGTLHLSRKRNEAALECLCRCCDLLGTLMNRGIERMSEDPHSPKIELVLSQALMNLGRGLDACGLSTQAAELIGQNLRIMETDFGLFHPLARIHIARGRAAFTRLRLRSWLGGEVTTAATSDQLALIDQLAKAAALLEERLVDPPAQFFLEEICDCFTDLGRARAHTGRKDAAQSWIAKSIELAARSGLTAAHDRAQSALQAITQSQL